MKILRCTYIHPCISIIKRYVIFKHQEKKATGRYLLFERLLHNNTRTQTKSWPQVRRTYHPLFGISEKAGYQLQKERHRLEQWQLLKLEMLCEVLYVRCGLLPCWSLREILALHLLEVAPREIKLWLFQGFAEFMHR